MPSSVGSLDITTLRSRYRAGTLDPVTVIETVLRRIAERGDDHVWIHLLPRDELLARTRSLAAAGPAGKPLFGIPFAIKDNIDLAAHPTTAACPSYAYVPQASAPVVAALVEAGAIPIGKTNLDQFATGLVGTRSPYGACSSVFNPAHISGGSSSGSAIAVAAGLVGFALGTDTAGSGRVPAMFGNLIGLKPTRGLLSSRGVVPACRSLDCISIFTLSAADAREVLAVAQGFDAADPFSRDRAAHAPTVSGAVAGCRFGVPRRADLQFFGNEPGRACFDAMLRLVERLGGELVETDFTPFLETARLLYEGPWLAERYVAIRDFIERNPEALHPVTRQIIESGGKPRAIDAFVGYYRLKELRRTIEQCWERFDVLLTPTAGRSYTIAEVLADPIRLNSNLGYYTNFMNLLDLSAVAVPAGFQADGLPFGVTLAAPAFNDNELCRLGEVLHRAQGLSMGAIGLPLPPVDAMASGGTSSAGVARVVVCGAHMSGLPLNHQLTERRGRLVRRCRTAPLYRMFALAGGPPKRPGLVRGSPGRSVEVEVWQLPMQHFGSFVDGIPGPLGIGTIELEDGERVHGFLCETYATAGAEDITELGSWRHYLERKRVG
ncbi:MAG TPA: allophanate hydrolase [Candidatus Cybelea sp.]|nr:allophanate hydrolase [Candidatus Cybelea sp.]